MGKSRCESYIFLSCISVRQGGFLLFIYNNIQATNEHTIDKAIKKLIKNSCLQIRKRQAKFHGFANISHWLFCGRVLFQ